MRNQRQLLLLALIGVAMAVLPASAQLRVERSVLAQGATSASDGSTMLAGTVGQTVIGLVSSASEIVGQGFWHLLPVQSSNAVPESRDENVSTGGTMLYQNVPNPFTTSTEIRLQLLKGGNVSLKLYDAVGHEVRTLIDGEREAGTIRITLSADDLESGYYTAQLKAEGVVRIIRMIVVR